MNGMSEIFAMQQQQAQAYYMGKGFAQMMERLDWIGRKLDGEEMETSYRDIIIKHQQQAIDGLKAKLNPRRYDEAQCCCDQDNARRDVYSAPPNENHAHGGI